MFSKESNESKKSLSVPGNKLIISDTHYKLINCGSHIFIYKDDIPFLKLFWFFFSYSLANIVK